MALLGDDGRGYELARKLESCGVWRTWLGDSTYSNFAPFLSSPSAWDSFISTDPSNSRAHIHLQLRVRALLFDKASSATTTTTTTAGTSSISHLNPSFLRLHPDDLYFTLDQPPPKNQSKAYRNDDLPETWYTQIMESYKANKKLLAGDRESPKRSPVEMASYVKYTANQKKRRLAFREGNHAADHASTMQPNGAGAGAGGSFVDDNENGGDGDESVFPEVTYMWNCVPESALPVSNRVEINPQKMKLYSSILDTLPPLMTRNPAMIERLGIRPEIISAEHGGPLKFRPQGTGRVLSLEQGTKLSQKVVARILLGVGFEASMEGPVEYFAEVMSKRIVKIGTNLKVLTDSYKKQCSAIELLKMLLKTVGFR